jgi:glucuronokinase
MVIRRSVGARVGLMGNPSDGFGGKTIASLIGDFTASVVLWESPQLEIIPHPKFDPFCFHDLDDLTYTASLDGYYGGLRLLFATCKRFQQHCHEAGIKLPNRNFTIAYDVNVPRQVGLAGSSAIITAAFQALMEFYELDDTVIPKPLQPTLVLEVETKELHIQAGLQDRVVQCYGGLVYMDFNLDLLDARGYGNYEPMDLQLLPPLYLAYSDHPSDSGKIHSTVRYRFDKGDPAVVDGMREFARYTDEARVALRARDYDTLSALMNANFELRRSIYGDEWIGPRNQEMVDLARSFGLPATFPGSGGAIVGLYEEHSQFEKARKAFRSRGYHFQKIHPMQAAANGHGETGPELHRSHRFSLMASCL